MVTFEDAIRVVQGFQKSAGSGGFSLGEVHAYGCGISDVVKVLHELSKRGLKDQQMAHLHQLGGEQDTST